MKENISHMGYRGIILKAKILRRINISGVN